MRQAAAAAALDHVHVGAERLQCSRRRVSGSGQEVIDDARRKEADADDRVRWVRLRDLAGSVMERLLRDGGEALLLSEVTEWESYEAAVTERALERREPSGHAVDALR
jgi:hypothetical protein